MLRNNNLIRVVNCIIVIDHLVSEMKNWGEVKKVFQPRKVLKFLRKKKLRINCWELISQNLATLPFLECLIDYQQL